MGKERSLQLPKRFINIYNKRAFAIYSLCGHAYICINNFLIFHFDYSLRTRRRKNVRDEKREERFLFFALDIDTNINNKRETKKEEEEKSAPPVRVFCFLRAFVVVVCVNDERNERKTASFPRAAFYGRTDDIGD